MDINGPPFHELVGLHWLYPRFRTTIAGMNKLSGLVLDRYDDLSPGGVREVIAGRYEAAGRSYGDELEKRAHHFSGHELQSLPDETFALVVSEGDHCLRKYSMADAGNLGISVLYFLETGHKLTPDLQKQAATNLVKGCGWYGVKPPEELQKVALGLNALMGATMVPGTMRESKKNIAASQGAGGAIMTPAQIKAQRLQMGV